MGVVDSVVLVDDDVDLCDAVGDVLLTVGVHECLAFASLAQVQARAYDVLHSELAILDINLGYDNPTGVDVFNWLRGEGYTAPIVFMTGHATLDPRLAAALELPNTCLMLKPFSVDALVGALRREKPAP
jgi:DNA-binding NtrC family response regulator